MAEIHILSGHLLVGADKCHKDLKAVSVLSEIRSYRIHVTSIMLWARILCGIC